MKNDAWLRNAFWNVCLSAALGSIIFVSASARGQAQPPIFPLTPITFNAGTVSFVGDFNGDGNPDLAYVFVTQTPAQTSLGIVLSYGSNAPTTVITPLLNVSATGCPVYFADVNNDKKLDLIFTCNGYLTVQFGNGDGTFQTPAYLAPNAAGPVFADFNGDGYLDIAAFTSSGQSNAVPQVAVFLNQGTTSPGLFASPKMYAAPIGGSGLVVGDFNGDGEQDLFTAIYTGTVLASGYTGYTIYYGNGDGTLKAPATESIAPYSGFTTGDFNGDGVTDLSFLLAPAQSALFTSVQILLGSTSGTFRQGSTLPVVALPVASGLPLTVEAVALTNDGNLDLVVNNSVLNVFHGDGKGGFVPTGSYAVSPPAGAPPLFADVNGDGKPDLILPGANTTFFVPGNGDGTFQAPPASPAPGLVADVNNDGIADMVFLPPQGGSYFGAELGRGDGTFAILNQTTPLPASSNGYFLTLGDFNADGKIDTVAVQPGSIGHNATCGPPDAQLLSYLGTGDGRFQAKGAPFALGVGNMGPGLTGDFNSDGNLDLILTYGTNITCQTQLLFVPGKGDGTFAAPIMLNVSQSGQSSSLLAGDLNNDQKLDFIWGDAVFLGNGDGTFKQIPVTIPGGGVALLADLNGDGILDAVYGPAIYAGNGDGTFQTTPFFTVPLPPFASAVFVATGDVNGDGNPDLLIVEQAEAPATLAVYLGDGHGNFTQDPNSYFVSSSGSNTSANTPTRLNNQAPSLPRDGNLDVLLTLTSFNVGTNGYTASLLNQTNPAPVKPVPLTTTTALQASLATAAPGAAITLTASVFGANPTGSVSFTANGNSLGTEALANGTAALQTSFAAAGSYTVTATYQGDGNNTASTSTAVAITITTAASATTLVASPGAGNVNGQITLKATVTGDSPTGSVSFAAGATNLGKATLSSGVATLQTAFADAGSYSATATYQGDQNNAVSTSSAVTVLIAAPDFTVAATPASGSIPPGQTATFTFNVTPVAGYAGTVKFSCGTLPTQAACSFTPASLTPSGSSPVSSTLTVTTAAAMALFTPDRRPGSSMPPWRPAGGLAIAGVIGLFLAPGKTRRWNRQLRLLSWGLLSASISLSILACGGGGSNSPSHPVTPAGSYTISVNASDSAGGPRHTVNIVLAVQ